MNSPLLIKLVIGIGVILGITYWFSNGPGVDTLNVTETDKEPLSVESPASSSDKNLKQPAIQDRDINAQNTHTDTKSDPEALVLYQFEDHGTAAYLDAKDRVPELAKGYEVIQFEVIRIDQNALMQVVTNESQKPQLDRKYSLPLLDGRSCTFAGRNYFEIEPKKSIQVDGQCQDLFGTFRGGYWIEEKRFSLIVKPYDQSAKYLIKTVAGDLAVLVQVAHTPQPPRSQ